MSFPPKTPSDLLRLNSYRILNQLASIEELAPWTDATNITVNGAYRTLWSILATGAPLCALLNMLGPPYVDVDNENTPGFVTDRLHQCCLTNLTDVILCKYL